MPSVTPRRADSSLAKLQSEADAERIAALSLEAPERQLLAALRWRARWFSKRLPSDPRDHRDDDVRHWLDLQSGAPLNA